MCVRVTPTKTKFEFGIRVEVWHVEITFLCALPESCRRRAQAATAWRPASLVNGAALWSRLSGNGNIYLFERRYLFAEAGCFERVKDV